MISKHKWPFFITLSPVILIALYFMMTFGGYFISHQKDINGMTNSRIYIVEGTIHTGIIIPANLLNHKLASYVKEDGTEFNYVEFGWGDREFFLNVPRLKDITVPIFMKSLFYPTSSVMHVIQYRNLPKEYYEITTVDISPKQLNILLNFIVKSFRLRNSNPIRIQFHGYYNSDQARDSFFEAEGQYHLFNTCNMWTTKALYETGIRTSIFSPFKYSVSRFVK